MACRDKLSKSLSRSSSSQRNLQLRMDGIPFTVNGDVIAAKSAKVAAYMKQNDSRNLETLVREIFNVCDPKYFEFVVRFCHGYGLDFLSCDNVIPTYMVASLLDMSEGHCTNNLLESSSVFFERSVLPHWNETVRALRSAGWSHRYAAELGLIDPCLDCLVDHALIKPQLLGNLIKNSEVEGGDERPNARRRLFEQECMWEDLGTLPLQFYERAIIAMNHRGVDPDYVAASVYHYAKLHVLSMAENAVTTTETSKRDIIEAVERLIPDQKWLLPTSLLFHILRVAVSLEANDDCRNGLEFRIGKQLEEATVDDLLMPSQGYAKEMKYDIDCVKRILKHFYSNYSDASDVVGLTIVAELIEDFLVEIADDKDLKVETFVSLAEASKAASMGIKTTADGIYRAVNVFLDRHSHLTELERENVCKVLESGKLSAEACEHAAKNNRLPVRFVMQVLFSTQLHLRETVARDGEAGKKGTLVEDEAAMADLERMSMRVKELEKKCLLIKQDIEDGCHLESTKKEKVGFWKELKIKMGCTRSTHDCNCQVKKKKKSMC